MKDYDREYKREYKKEYNIDFAHYNTAELLSMAEKRRCLDLNQAEIQEVNNIRRIFRENGPSHEIDISDELFHKLKLYESQIRYPEHYKECVAWANRTIPQKCNIPTSKQQKSSGLYCNFFTKVLIGTVVAVGVVVITATTLKK